MNEASLNSRSEACFWLYRRTLSACSWANWGLLTFARMASLAARSSRRVWAAPMASGVSLPVAVASAASPAAAPASRLSRSASQAATSFVQSGFLALATGAAVVAAGAEPTQDLRLRLRRGVAIDDLGCSTLEIRELRRPACLLLVGALGVEVGPRRGDLGPDRRRRGGGRLGVLDELREVAGGGLRLRRDVLCLRRQPDVREHLLERPASQQGFGLLARGGDGLVEGVGPGLEQRLELWLHLDQLVWRARLSRRRAPAARPARPSCPSCAGRRQGAARRAESRPAGRSGCDEGRAACPCRTSGCPEGRRSPWTGGRTRSRSSR